MTSGFRINSGGAHLAYGVDPDIAVFAKAIANVFPMAAIVGRAPVMDAAQETLFSSTAWTERVGPVAALATLRKHREQNVAKHLMRIGTHIQKGWTEASQATGLPLAHQGNRQTDPDWPDWDCANTRRRYPTTWKGRSPQRSIYDLMLSQLAATVGFFRSLGIRAEVSHLAFEPAILDALPPAPTEAVDISFVGTVSADHQQRVALLEAIARRAQTVRQYRARRSRLLSAAPLLSRRGLGRGHVSGPASFAHYA